jgi:hypothetical protein
MLQQFLPLFTMYIHVVLDPNDDIHGYENAEIERIYRLVYNLTLYGHGKPHGGGLLDIVDIAVAAIHRGFRNTMTTWAGMTAQARETMLQSRSVLVYNALMYLLLRHPHRRQEVTDAMQWANVMYYPGGPGFVAAVQDYEHGPDAPVE